ncbi:MAG: hypothetical protein ABS76_01765 [Pelagibacterium sp. SCN 64-44]|nr:MAG: hypothetical protein ABS76_01765 [Pelagibacterium sp. SCN 64-44]
MGAVAARDLAYGYGGAEMLGRFFIPEEQGERPGILVLHGAHGVDGFILSRAERLAGLGHAVLAIDLWGGRELVSDPAAIGPRLGAFAGDRDMWMGRIEAARTALVAQPGVDNSRIGALGYCFGGTGVLEFARRGGAVKGVVSFHGGLDMVEDDWSGQAGASVLICTGAADPMARQEDRVRVEAGMSAADVAWETNLYGGVKHAFTEPDHPGQPPFAGFDARAERRSWVAMREFFQDVLA